ncbi:MAG: glycosyltransferase family 4 protein [Alphaproteobacteria bacterium]|nr:glycosyltransferase family 4 protein [Alphaproteobacteria bacterium]OJV45129.1 MAG: hypothetical protein BGO28_03845 [Alphaproteobacteria bacterium 43-37]
MMKTILFVIAEDWYAYTHRFHQMQALQNAGFTVILASRFHKHRRYFQDAGIETIELNRIKRDNLNPLAELLTVFELYRLYRKIRPTILHHVGVKLIVNGMIAALLAGAKKSINVFAGLGYLFVKKTPVIVAVRTTVVLLLKLCFRAGQHWIICQNHDDAAILRKHFPTIPQNIILGAGIDLNHWRPPLNLPHNAQPKIILSARMVANKGVPEAVIAVHELNQEGVPCELHLVGEPDPQNPSRISEFQLQTWNDQAHVFYHGKQDDVRPWLHACDIACLPSYTEGLPKALLEAAACGLPLVGSDIPGIREVIVENQTGLFSKARDVASLKAALKQLILSPSLRHQMGQNAKQLVEEKFSKDKINQQLIELHNKMCESP